MEWHEKEIQILKWNIKIYVFCPVLFVVLSTTLILLSRYLLGRDFVSVEIMPIDVPNFSFRSLSALTFVTSGAILYAIGFYRRLYEDSRSLGFSFTEYNQIKAVIWIFLVFGVTYRIIVWSISVINSLLSFLFNLWSGFLFYGWEILISLLITLILVLTYLKNSKYPQFGVRAH